MTLFTSARQTTCFTRCSRDREGDPVFDRLRKYFDRLRKYFSKLIDKEPMQVAEVLDGATTAPLSDHQIQSIIENQNPRYEIQQLIAATGAIGGKAARAQRGQPSGDHHNSCRKLRQCSLRPVRGGGWHGRPPVRGSGQQCRHAHPLGLRHADLSLLPVQPAHPAHAGTPAGDHG